MSPQLLQSNALSNNIEELGELNKRAQEQFQSDIALQKAKYA